MSCTRWVTPTDFFACLSCQSVKHIGGTESRWLCSFRLAQLHKVWSLSADEQLVRSVNIRCEKKSQTADSLDASTFTLAPSELAHYDLLAARTPREISIRLALLQV